MYALPYIALRKAKIVYNFGLSECNIGLIQVELYQNILKSGHVKLPKKSRQLNTAVCKNSLISVHTASSRTSVRILRVSTAAVIYLWILPRKFNFHQGQAWERNLRVKIHQCMISVFIQFAHPVFFLAPENSILQTVKAVIGWLISFFTE